MVERKRIGLLFSYNENWIAGTYYILNVIHALNTLEDIDKPKIVVLSETTDNLEIVRKETAYPYLSYAKFPAVVEYTFLEKVINKLSKLIRGKSMIHHKRKIPPIDFLYPKQVRYICREGIKKVNWVPDFQEAFLPHLFSEEEVANRKKYQSEVLSNGDFVVFSSKDAQSHFTNMYPEAAAEQFLLRFAVQHPNFSEVSISEVRKKFNLPETYFFAPNQFWQHKNHKVILEAVRQLKAEGTVVTVAFSGKENDYRNKDYVTELKEFVQTHQLEAQIKFLGFLDRKEQLCLLQHAISIIQPSLFEGWSTVVEDAKALDKHIILSSLPVHKEQIASGVTFFDPLSALELANAIKINHNHPPKAPGHDYHIDRLNFGKQFMDLVHLATQ